MAKVIPIGRTRSTREELVLAVGDVLSEKGYNGLTADAVAQAAGVKTAILRHIFGNFSNLVKEYAHSEVYWPTADELLDGREQELLELPPQQQIAWFFKHYLQALRNRPQTVRILTWELSQRDERTVILEQIRIRTSLEFFERLRDDTPDDVDLSAIIVVLASAVHHLVVRAQQHRHFGGLDFRSERGWQRVALAIDLLMQGALDKKKKKNSMGKKAVKDEKAPAPDQDNANRPRG